MIYKYKNRYVKITNSQYKYYGWVTVKDLKTKRFFRVDSWKLENLTIIDYFKAKRLLNGRNSG